MIGLMIMEEETYPEKNLETSDYKFVLKKLSFTKKEFENYYIIRPIYRSIKKVLNKVKI